MKKIFILLTLLYTSNVNAQETYKFDEQSCKEIYYGIISFIENTDVAFKQAGEAIGKDETVAKAKYEEAFGLTQLAANYTQVFDVFCTTK